MIKRIFSCILCFTDHNHNLFVIVLLMVAKKSGVFLFVPYLKVVIEGMLLL